MEFARQDELDKHIQENPLTRFGVRRPHIVFVMIMIIMVLGFFAFSSMNAELFPNMNIPYLIVIAQHENPQEAIADPDTTAVTTLNVTNRIESTLLQVSGVQTIQTMTNAASVVAFIEFDTSVDISAAEFQVTMAMIRLGNFLYDNDFQQMPIVMALDPSMMPVLVFSVDFVI